LDYSHLTFLRARQRDISGGITTADIASCNRATSRRPAPFASFLVCAPHNCALNRRGLPDRKRTATRWVLAQHGTRQLDARALLLADDCRLTLWFRLTVLSVLCLFDAVYSAVSGSGFRVLRTAHLPFRCSVKTYATRIRSLRQHPPAISVWFMHTGLTHNTRGRQHKRTCSAYRWFAAPLPNNALNATLRAGSTLARLSPHHMRTPPRRTLDWFRC